MPLPAPENHLQASASADYFRLLPAAPRPQAEGLTWRTQLLLFLIGALLVILRRPDAIMHPQFFAEDGSVWFADALRLGFWRSLILPDAGYIQTFPRLVAGLATLVPFLYAPLLMNLIGIVVQVLPINLLASARLSKVGSPSFRIVMAFLYLALPNSRELDVVITNAQWHLAWIACLLLVAAAPCRTITRVFYVVLLVLSGLTGPFCILLLPVNALLWWIRRTRWLIVTFAILAICSALQIVVLSGADPAIRNKAPLGASLKLFVDIISGHVFLAAIFGSGNYSASVPWAVLALVALAGSAVVIYALLKADWEFRVVLLFCLLVFAASLKSPLVSRTEPQWPVLNQVSGIRYWFFPTLAFLYSLLWCAKGAQLKPVRIAAFVLLILSVAGIARDWEYPAFPDRNFPHYAQTFESLPPGEAMDVPLYPDGWTMHLVKTSKSCSDLPIGLIDLPPGNAKISGPVQITGWVTGRTPIQAIQIYLDGKQVTVTQPGIRRPDVDARYGGSAVPNKGWSTVLSVSQINPGKHVLQVRARAVNGCDAVIADRHFELAASESAQGKR